MEKKKELDLLEVAKKLKNQKAKEWRDNNKDKVREINRRYWLNKAKKELMEKEK